MSKVYLLIVWIIAGALKLKATKALRRGVSLFMEAGSTLGGVWRARKPKEQFHNISGR